VKRWDRTGRHWNNREVHFFWESPLAALLMIVILACIMAIL
jgi:hypothetical protein